MSRRIETHAVHANGLTFEVDACGEGDRLALCLHGFPELAFSWRHQLPLLARLGWRAWAPNLRGYGRTSRPTSVADYAMPHLVADVAGLIDASGARRTLLIGHDWGGAIAWQAARGLRRRIERLIVLNMPHPACFLDGLAGWRQRLRSWYMAAFHVPWLPERILTAGHGWLAAEAMAATASDRSRFPPEVLRVYRDAAARRGAMTAMLNYYRALPLAGPPPDAVAALRERIEIPTLMIWGEEDFALGRELLYGTRAFVPDLVLRTLPGISHWVQQEAPETVNTLIAAWLTGRPVPVPGPQGRLAEEDGSR
ncbi:MAG: alpha/beta hydrolase [Acidobacteria bacterium]|nr:alpha/beta hydrolase [Acidobacteriota bacterium]